MNHRHPTPQVPVFIHEKIDSKHLDVFVVLKEDGKEEIIAAFETQGQALEWIGHILDYCEDAKESMYELRIKS